MSDKKSLAHSVWDCKYHIVWIPKCRKKQLYGKVAKYLGEIFHQLARQRESKIVQGHLPGSHPYANRDTAEICSVADSGVHQREKRKQ